MSYSCSCTTFRCHCHTASSPLVCHLDVAFSLSLSHCLISPGLSFGCRFFVVIVTLPHLTWSVNWMSLFRCHCHTASSDLVCQLDVAFSLSLSHCLISPGLSIGCRLFVVIVTLPHLTWSVNWMSPFRCHCHSASSHLVCQLDVAFSLSLSQCLISPGLSIGCRLFVVIVTLPHLTWSVNWMSPFRGRRDILAWTNTNEKMYFPKNDSRLKHKSSRACRFTQ